MDKLLQIRVTYFTLKNYFASLIKRKSAVKKEGKKKKKKKKNLSNTSVPRLSEELTQSCEGIAKEAEVPEALKQLENGSSLCFEGITIEFLKVFWNYIGKLITTSFNTSFDDCSLSTSQGNAAITLIHKGKDVHRNELN